MYVFTGTGAGAYTAYLASRDAASAGAKARSAETAVEWLEARLDTAMLACEAMWQILSEKLDVTEEELLQRIEALDRSDGRRDGRVRKPPVTCPRCERTISRKRPTCMYCGEELMQDPFV